MRIYVLLLSVVCAQACRTVNDDSSNDKAEFAPGGVPVDWGSLQPMSTTPLSNEGKLANAAARRLNEAARLSELLIGMPQGAKVEDGTISVPVKMLANDGHDHNHPFGDGQKNASLGWAGWPAQSTDVPLAMTLAQVKTSNTESRLLVIEPALEMVQLLLGVTPAMISAELSSDQNQKMSVDLTKDTTRGVYRGVVVIGSELNNVQGSAAYPATVTLAPDWLTILSDRWGWPRIKVRFYSGTPTDNRYWPVLFRFPAQNREDAEATLPTAGRSLPGTSKSIGSLLMTKATPQRPPTR